VDWQCKGNADTINRTGVSLPATALTAEALSSVYGVDVRVEGLTDGRTVCVPSRARHRDGWPTDTSSAHS